MLRRVLFAALVAVALPSTAAAQPYVGGALAPFTQTPSADDHLGGTTRGGSVAFGVQVSRRVAVEFEPSFLGPYSWTYTYSPSPTSVADVVARRHDTFYSFQLRIRSGILEPVAGLSYVHGKISRHATLKPGTPYFDDNGTDRSIAAVGGLDAAVRCASHFYVVPTFRVFVRFQSAPEDSFADPFGEQTRTGAFTFRYGAGVRVPF